MIKWTRDELNLAVRLTSTLGFSFEKASRIMVRHGFSQRLPSEISKKIETDAPRAWSTLQAAQEKRQSVKLCGINAPIPRRRFQTISADLVRFIQSLPEGESLEEICWSARNAGFDVNLTDIDLTTKTAGYKPRVLNIIGIEYDEAIMQDLCLWPASESNACGRDREVGRYCGAHSVRALGSLPY